MKETPAPVFKVLVVADPVADLLVDTDSTLRIVQEMLERENTFDVHWVDYAKLDLGLKPEVFLNTLPAQQVLHCELSDANFMGLGPVQKVDARDFDVVLLRQDPPVDKRFARCCQLFEPMRNEALFVNNPAEIWRLKEHILPTEYPDDAIPTTVCHSLPELMAAVKKQNPEAVLKPENESSGIGITFVHPQVAPQVLEDYYKKYGPTVIVQPYLDEITKSGDLRVLSMNGKILGSVLRVPQKGSRLANFYQGGTAAKRDPSARQIEICRAVATDLVQKGIYLVGFDFIGDKLSEINITSPTGMVQAGRLSGTRLEKMFNDEVLSLLRRD